MIDRLAGNYADHMSLVAPQAGSPATYDVVVAAGAGPSGDKLSDPACYLA